VRASDWRNLERVKFSESDLFELSFPNEGEEGVKKLGIN